MIWLSWLECCFSLSIAICQDCRKAVAKNGLPHSAEPSEHATHFLHRSSWNVIWIALCSSIFQRLPRDKLATGLPAKRFAAPWLPSSLNFCSILARLAALLRSCFIEILMTSCPSAKPRTSDDQPLDFGVHYGQKKWKNLMFMITSSEIIVHQQQNLEMILEIAFFPFRTRSGMLRTGPGVRCDAQAGWLHHQQWPDPGRWTWQCDWSPNGSTPPRWMATKNWWTSWQWRSDQLRWSHSQLNRWIGDMKNWLVAPLLKSLPFTPV